MARSAASSAGVQRCGHPLLGRPRWEGLGAMHSGRQNHFALDSRRSVQTFGFFPAHHSKSIIEPISNYNRPGYLGTGRLPWPRPAWAAPDSPAVQRSWRRLRQGRLWRWRPGLRGSGRPLPRRRTGRRRGRGRAAAGPPRSTAAALAGAAGTPCTPGARLRLARALWTGDSLFETVRSCKCTRNSRARQHRTQTRTQAH